MGKQPQKKNRPLPSLKALVVQTAKMLRLAASKPPFKKRTLSKKGSDLSTSNKVSQIASLLRSVTKKKKRKK